MASTYKKLPPKKLPAIASQTGSFAEQEMYGRIRMTRRCSFLFSSPRVVRIAAAVHPNPSSSEKTARPVSPTRRNKPSVMNASADIHPLSSNKNSAKYKTASCGKKENSIPTHDSSAQKKSPATGLPPAAAAEASHSPAAEAARSMSALHSVPGIHAPNAR